MFSVPYGRLRQTGTEGPAGHGGGAAEQAVPGVGVCEVHPPGVPAGTKGLGRGAAGADSPSAGAGDQRGGQRPAPRVVHESGRDWLWKLWAGGVLGRGGGGG